MLQDYHNKSVHVEDVGLFVELARKLSESFGQVTYCSPWVHAFPSSKDTEVGEGMEGVKRVGSIHEIIQDTDLFVFPELYCAPTQRYLLDLGKRVWGSREGDELEIFRADAKGHFEELGIPQGPYEVVEGINSLRKYLKAHKGKVWVKIEETRGDTETFCVDNYELSKGQIDELDYSLGPKAEIMNFVVEESLEGTLDIAIDTFNVNGKYPEIAILGTEMKDECYVGARRRMNEVPPTLFSIYDALSPTLKKYGYCNFLSLESRVKGRTYNLGDPCMRGGSPPLELQLEMIENLPDILWFGAQDGKVIDPEIKSAYGVWVSLRSEWSDKNPLRIDFPERLSRKVKLRYNSIFDDEMWIMPHGTGDAIGAIVDHGNNLEEIVEGIKKNAGEVKGIKVTNCADSLDLLMDRVKQLRGWGVKI